MKRKAVGTRQKYSSLLMAMLIVLSAMPAWTQDKIPTLRGPAAATAKQSAAKISSPQQTDTLTCNLWHQPQSSVNTNPYANQDFDTVDDSLDIFLADDFRSPRPWFIDTIFVPGGLWNGATTLANAATLHFEIYRDGGGKPDGDPRGGGKPPTWSLAVSPADKSITIDTTVIDLSLGLYQSNVTLTLAQPVKLPSGTYWLVFYPQMDLNTSGQYGRFTADTTNRVPAQVINPDQGWRQNPADPDSPLLPASWSNASVLPLFSQHDLAFCLQGKEGFYWPMFIPATTGAGIE